MQALESKLADQERDSAKATVAQASRVYDDGYVGFRLWGLGSRV